ncbi:hypothetical protein LCGC14_1325640 [marine sediment metagenome]|uniref:Uncharacterized protein n=1 Tax=marine sediment metagenome TaxID=412755 RepID=A0A0F9KIB9_9ZZZZ
MREWYVIENSRNRTVFGTDEIKGYIPRDVVENELGISHKEGCQWFTREQSEAMRAHLEWRTDEPK